MKTPSVVRVAVSNNFNCTDKEWKHLDNWAQVNPDKSFFVNCNINTPKIQTIRKHPYKAVVTANPNLVLDKTPVPAGIPKDPYFRTGHGIRKILAKLNPIKDHLAFVRVKYIPNNEGINHLLVSLLGEGYKVVVTLQRFIKKETLLKYTGLDYYQHSCSRYRLTGIELQKITEFITNLRETSNAPVWICDQSGKGCQGCGLCSKLTTGQDLTIYSLNLSTSGVCPYSCPDCYAKAMQKFTVGCGHRPMAYDKIQQNDKQAGRTKHIQEASKCPPTTSKK